MAVVDLTNILKNTKTDWVSISKDYKKIVAKDQTLEGLLKKLDKLGNPDGYLLKASRDYSRYIGA